MVQRRDEEPEKRAYPPFPASGPPEPLEPPGRPPEEAPADPGGPPAGASAPTPLDPEKFHYLPMGLKVSGTVAVFAYRNGRLHYLDRMEFNEVLVKPDPLAESPYGDEVERLLGRWIEALRSLKESR